MGQIELIEKIRGELDKGISEESQVIYILSRIRKYLEIKNQKEQYKWLNFYCNWALHSRIDNTKSVTDVLREFISGDNTGFLSFDHLKDDLKKFLVDNELSLKLIDDPDSYYQFVNLLIDIYSDTPLSVWVGAPRAEITINKPRTPVAGSRFSVGYEVKFLE